MSVHVLCFRGSSLCPPSGCCKSGGRPMPGKLKSPRRTAASSAATASSNLGCACSVAMQAMQIICSLNRLIVKTWACWRQRSQTNMLVLRGGRAPVQDGVGSSSSETLTARSLLIPTPPLLPAPIRERRFQGRAKRFEQFGFEPERLVSGELQVVRRAATLRLLARG